MGWVQATRCPLCFLGELDLFPPPKGKNSRKCLMDTVLKGPSLSLTGLGAQASLPAVKTSPCWFFAVRASSTFFCFF